MTLPISFYRKNLLFTCLTIISLLAFSTSPNVVHAQTTTVYVDPPSIVADPGDTFNVDVNIADVLDLYAWGIKIRWNRDLLQVTNVVEGPFLQGQPEGTYFAKAIFASYIDCSCTTVGLWPGVPGSGTLMTVTFLVKETGETALEIYDSKLRDSTVAEIAHVVEDGYFYTTWPVADFEYTPASYGRPIVGEGATFDASASYDPDGGNETYPSGIVDYQWDFGDNATDTGKIVTHAYDAADEYTVTLNVTDDEGETYYRTLDVTIKFHEVAVLNVTASPLEAKVGSMVTIDVRVMNNGSHSESFNVTTYYFDYTYYRRINKTQTKVDLRSGGTVTLTFQWNTTGVAPDSYAIYAYAYLVDSANLEFRPGEEENTLNNALLGGPVNLTLVDVHDIAIRSVIVTPSEVNVGGTVTISVRLKNEGNVADTFSVSVYNSTSLIGTNDMTLLVGVERTMHFSWFAATNTTVETAYNVSAQVPPITNPPPGTNETDVSDNIFVNVTGTIRLLPAAFFAFSPSEPILGQTISFDASASYAPGLPAKTIVSYGWDFGDGTSDTGVTATHAFNASGQYSVALTVVDSNGLSNTLRRSVTIPKLDSTISLSASISVVPVGSEGTALSGSISPVRAGFKVSIYYAKSGEATWVGLANVTSDGNSQYSYTWIPWLEPGTYQFKASWTGDDITLSAESSVISVEVVQKITSSISISASPTTITLGESISIGGSLLPAQAGVDVTIWRMLSGSDWTTLTTVTTNANGQYAHTWQPADAGTYVLKASWAGDGVIEAAESDVQVVVVEEAPAPDIFLYSTVGLLVAIGIILVYFMWLRKPKVA